MPCTPCELARLAAGQALSAIARGDQAAYTAATQQMREANAQAAGQPVQSTVINATFAALSRLAARRVMR